MGDDLEELLPMLVAASKDERLSTGALYSRAASMLEGMSRELAVQTALVERAVEDMKEIAGYDCASLNAGPPRQLFNDGCYSCIARAFLAEIGARSAEAIQERK